MPDRIFPTQRQESLGSEKEFNGIKIDDLKKHLAYSKEDNTKKIPTELFEELMSKIAKKELPEALKKHQFKKKDEKPEEEEETEETETEETETDDTEDKKIVRGKGTCKDCGKSKSKCKCSKVAQLEIEDYDLPDGSDADDMYGVGGEDEEVCPQCGETVSIDNDGFKGCESCGWKETSGDQEPLDDTLVEPDIDSEGIDAIDAGGSDDIYASNNKNTKEARTLKIVFTDPSQIDADAVLAAKNSGDDKLFKTILAARKDRREYFKNKILASINKEKEIENKVAERNRARFRIVESAKVIDGIKISSTNNVIVEIKEKNMKDFKEVKELTASERDVFVKKAQKENFPQEYIDAFLGVPDEEDNSEVEIKNILSSELDKKTKTAAVKAIVKTAKLDKDQVNRQIRYWTEELGYDPEWVKDLFTTQYDN